MAAVEDNVDVDTFLNTGASKDLYMPAVNDEPFRDHDDQPGRPTTSMQRLTFHVFLKTRLRRPVIKL